MGEDDIRPKCVLFNLFDIVSYCEKEKKYTNVISCGSESIPSIIPCFPRRALTPPLPKLGGGVFSLSSSPC